MENPFLKLAAGLTEEYGELCMAGRHATFTCYDFYDTFGVGHLLVTRKDQFPDFLSAFVTVINKYFLHIQEDNPYYVPPANAEEFIWEAEMGLISVYGAQEINEIPVEKFLERYDKAIEVMTGFEAWYEDGKKKFLYNYHGIYKDGQDYTGNYRWFDPLLGLNFEKCFSIIDQDWEKIEYLGISDKFYAYLTWKYAVPPQL